MILVEYTPEELRALIDPRAAARTPGAFLRALGRSVRALGVEEGSCGDLGPSEPTEAV